MLQENKQSDSLITYYDKKEIEKCEKACEEHPALEINYEHPSITLFTRKTFLSQKVGYCESTIIFDTKEEAKKFILNIMKKNDYSPVISSFGDLLDYRDIKKVIKKSVFHILEISSEKSPATYSYADICKTLIAKPGSNIRRKQKKR
jgi:hypothetical protein